MMKKEMLFFVLCLFSLQVWTQSLDWVNSIGSNGEDIAKKILIFSDQSTLVLGTFSDTVSLTTTLGPVELHSKGYSDIFIQKNAIDGGIEWVKSFGGTNIDICTSSCLDEDENILITGFFSDTADFDPGAGVTELTGSSDYFVLKLNNNGTFLWAKKFGGSSYDYGYDIATDINSNVFITGQFGESVDFSGSGNFHTSNGSTDIFIQKLDENGDFLWARSFGASDADVGYALDIDNDGNVLMAGIFGGTVDFDPGVNTSEIVCNGELDAFVLKLSTDGEYIWARSFGGYCYDYAYDVIHNSDNDVIVTGSFCFEANFDAENGGLWLYAVDWSDVYLTKLNSSGELLWVNSFGSTYEDLGNAVYVDSVNNIYLTGFYSDSIDLDPGSGVQIASCNGFMDVFVQKVGTDGSLAWTTTFGGTNMDKAYSIASDKLQNVYVCGSFKDEVNFNLSSGSNILSAEGIEDAFCIKIKKPENTITNIPIQNLHIYPNPTHAILNIEFSNNLNQSNALSNLLELYSSDGRLLLKQQMQNTQHTIDLSIYEAGIYFLKVSNRKNYSLHKVLVR